MKARIWMGSVAVGFTVEVLLAPGCGGEASIDVNDAGDVRDVTVSPADSSSPGPDAKVDGKADAISDASAVCDAGPALSSIDFAEAGLGDAATSCRACVFGTCPSQIQACDSDCVCRGAAANLFYCLGQPNPTACVLGGNPETLSNGPAQALGTCLFFSSCRAICLPGLDAALDGARDGAGDAAEAGLDAAEGG